jgi:hypothetical protein
VTTLEATLETICAGVRERRPPARMETRIVAVDGLGGAGKSSFVRRLSAALDGAEIAHTDDFASWDNPLDWWPDLVDRLLVPLSRNEIARFERSRWGGADRGWAEVRPAGVVILEGVTASREAFRPFLTYAVWIETPDLQLRRGSNATATTYARSGRSGWPTRSATARPSDRTRRPTSSSAGTATSGRDGRERVWLTRP